MAVNNRSRSWAQGAGPGAITPDGCPIEVYALLSPHDEPEIVHAAVPDSAAILELGAGTGRITHPLLAFGHHVVAVDESADMLRHIKGAQTVHASIETLDLARRFDAVLFASYLIDIPDEELRQSWLAACRRHVRDDGCVVIQRHTPEWIDSAVPHERDVDGVIFRMREVTRPSPHLISVVMEYEFEGRRWTHSFTHARISDPELVGNLAEAGLVIDDYLTENRSWIRARPI